MNTNSAPASLTLEFLRTSGEFLLLGDMGTAFLTQHNIGPDQLTKPFRIAIDRRSSKAGNSYYEYSQNSVSLPDGLSTWLRLEGVVIPLGGIHPSQKSHPTREGTATIVVGGLIYLVTAWLTESKDPYWVKVVAHKKPDSTAALKKAQAAPRGGRIL